MGKKQQSRIQAQQTDNVRTTVSIAKVVYHWAEQMMDAQGFNRNFSAYVAHLIRRDKEQRHHASAEASSSASDAGQTDTGRRLADIVRRHGKSHAPPIE